MVAYGFGVGQFLPGFSVNYSPAVTKGMRESDSSLQRYKAKQFAKIIADRGRIKEGDVELDFALTEKVVVHGEGRLMVVLLDGTEVECTVE